LVVEFIEGIWVARGGDGVDAAVEGEVWDAARGVQEWVLFVEAGGDLVCALVPCAAEGEVEQGGAYGGVVVRDTEYGEAADIGDGTGWRQAGPASKGRGQIPERSRRAVAAAVPGDDRLSEGALIPEPDAADQAVVLFRQ